MQKTNRVDVTDFSLSVPPERAGTVAIALSGGVDSSVAAALLKARGYDVIGVMLRLWSQPGQESENACCTLNAVALARRVAEMLDIPFHLIDAREEFRETIVTYFLDSYTRGETPNPCVWCNRKIRWGTMLRAARELGAARLATGHYVRLRAEPDGSISLLRGVDPSKDQSYMLHLLTQEALAVSFFPVGTYRKSEIRALASRFGLPTAARADSQDLCFLGGGDYREFLRTYAPQTVMPGPILRRDGTHLGVHEGLAFYTIGQRRGLGIAYREPLYVLEKDTAHNALIVGTASECGTRDVRVGNINWISGAPPAPSFRAQVKIRYSAEDAPAQVMPRNGTNADIRFDAPQEDVTPGQSAVFYQGEVCLGGGTILFSEKGETAR